MHPTSFTDWLLARPLLLLDVAGQMDRPPEAYGSFCYHPSSSSSPELLLLPWTLHTRPFVPLFPLLFLFCQHTTGKGNSTSAYLLPTPIQLLISTRCLFMYLLYTSSYIPPLLNTIITQVGNRLIRK